MNNDAPNKPSISGEAPTTPSSAGKSEAEFLKEEASNAQAAIKRALAELRNNLNSTVDPKLLTRDHPWIALSTVAVAGFAAAVTLTPSKQQQAMRALVEWERARHPVPPESDKKAMPTSEPHHQGIIQLIVSEAAKAIRPLLVALVTAGINRMNDAAGKGATDTEPAASPTGNPHPTNGHHDADQVSSPS
jgi:hypothetical protein